MGSIHGAPRGVKDPQGGSLGGILGGYRPVCVFFENEIKLAAPFIPHPALLFVTVQKPSLQSLT